MVDLEKLNNDLQEVSQMVDRGHLTRGELLLLKIRLAWTVVTVRRALESRRHAQERSLS